MVAAHWAAQLIILDRLRIAPDCKCSGSRLTRPLSGGCLLVKLCCHSLSFCHFCKLPIELLFSCIFVLCVVYFAGLHTTDNGHFLQTYQNCFVY